MAEREHISILKKAAFASLALSLLAASLTSARADDCADLHARIAQFQDSDSRMQIEVDRVQRITPTPSTDAAVCAAILKATNEAKDLMLNAGSCGTDKFNDDMVKIYDSDRELGGLFHCPD